MTIIVKKNVPQKNRKKLYVTLKVSKSKSKIHIWVTLAGNNIPIGETWIQYGVEHYRNEFSKRSSYKVNGKVIPLLFIFNLVISLYNLISRLHLESIVYISNKRCTGKYSQVHLPEYFGKIIVIRNDDVSRSFNAFFFKTL